MTKQRMTDAWWLAAPLSVLVLSGGCNPATSGTSLATSPDSANAKSSEEARPCPASEAMISDGEVSGNQVNVTKGRSGSWYTFIDSRGSTVTPSAASDGATFTMAPGGANGSKFAAHMTGQIGQGDAVCAGMGFNFLARGGTYDGTAYEGVSFWAKKGPGSTARVRLNVADANTDPRGKVCSACFNDFGLDLTLNDEWTRYVVPYVRVTQIDGWGSPRPAALDVSKLYGLKFQVSEAGAAYDVWVDEVRFTGCDQGRVTSP